MGPMLGFKRFFNARRVVAGVELVQKIVKGQFDVPASFGTDPCWRRESCAICNRSLTDYGYSDKNCLSCLYRALVTI